MSGRRLAALLVLLPPLCGAGDHPSEPSPLPPLLYELPAAGSYALPPIARVGSHELLEPDGAPAPLLGLAPGQLALVAFVYLRCADAHGCPLSLATLQRVDRALAGRPELRGRVRLVTVSFDPETDDPEAMGRIRHHLAPRGDWRFLTAPDTASLAPVLADYGQDAVPRWTADGSKPEAFRHVVKVFLVDDARRLRNVYSTGYLDHRVVLRDVETLLLAP